MMASSSVISASSMWRRPAVSTISTSKPVFFASSSAPAARLTGSISPAGSCTRSCACFPSTFSCWMAAGLRTSVDTSIGCRPCRVSQRPSFPAVVVLPDPCSPSSMTTRGDLCVCDRPPCVSPNSASISSRTIRTTCCEGVRLRRTSWSIARSRTRSVNALTTLKLTSASSSASRISRSAASTFVSVRRPSPRIERKTSCRRVLSASNITDPMTRIAACARAQGYASTGVSRSNANPYRRRAGARLSNGSVSWTGAGRRGRSLAPNCRRCAASLQSSSRQPPAASCKP